jgi:ferredoxin
METTTDTADAVAIKIAEEDVLLRIGESLLDADDRIGLPLEFGCRGGACGTCLIEIVAGIDNVSAKTAEEEALIPALVPDADATMRLACQIAILGPVQIRQSRRLV